MKNKAKKILAGLSLGLIGVGCLTGCSMSDDQKAVLDLVTEKSDKIVNLLEENMEYQNTQLSKQEAYEMIVLSHSAFEFGLINKVQIKHSNKHYYGYFDDLRSNKINTIDYFANGNVKYLNQTFERDELSCYYLADHENNLYLLWDDDDYVDELEENSPEVTIGASLGNFVNQLININEISVEDIYGVDVLEDGTWCFSIIVDKDPYGESTIFDYKTLYKIQIKNNLMYKVEMLSVCTQNRDGGDPEFATSYHDEILFNYDAEMDFSVNEEKRIQLLAEKNA